MTSENRAKPVTAVLVGAGNRGMLYSSYALSHPDELRITAVADPDARRRTEAADKFDIPEELCFDSVESLIGRGRLAEAAINGTMDRQHVETTMPLLEAGYSVLLEKPICTEEEDLFRLLEAAKRVGSTVMVCHVLRYAPFYASIKQRILDGEIGEIVSIQTSEHVSYHHMTVGYVRGKWNREEICGSTMLMAKCCHDLDLIAWMKNGVRPVAVSSFGSLMQYRPENAPEGAGTRCMTDCAVEADCIYSAKKLHLDRPHWWGQYVWADLRAEGDDLRAKEESLRTDNPYGRCVYRCDNNTVDHQSVSVFFEDGCTATHNMIGGTAKPGRYIHIVGTAGEIRGLMEEGRYTLIHPDPRADGGFREEEVSFDVTGDGHGGGDFRLVADFISALRGRERSISATRLDDSIYGHLTGFAADRARMTGTVVTLDRLPGG